ncbi:hypothetical protein [Lysinibacter cavernae]|uniref:hypothetical protein n=1 Tax=Lysinibacter cavernae TaxID=1640652 RepID=UPI00361FB217
MLVAAAVIAIVLFTTIDSPADENNRPLGVREIEPTTEPTQTSTPNPKEQFEYFPCDTSTVQDPQTCVGDGELFNPGELASLEQAATPEQISISQQFLTQWIQFDSEEDASGRWSRLTPFLAETSSVTEDAASKPELSWPEKSMQIPSWHARVSSGLPGTLQRSYADPETGFAHVFLISDYTASYSSAGGTNRGGFKDAAVWEIVLSGEKVTQITEPKITQ